MPASAFKDPAGGCQRFRRSGDGTCQSSLLSNTSYAASSIRPTQSRTSASRRNSRRRSGPFALLADRFLLPNLLRVHDVSLDALGRNVRCLGGLPESGWSCLAPERLGVPSSLFARPRARRPLGVSRR